MDRPTKGIEISVSDKQSKPRGIDINVQNQQPINMRVVDKKFLVYLVLDCSTSMKGNKLAQAKQGILGFAVDAIKKEYSIGLMSFSFNAARLCEPTTNLHVIEQGLNSCYANGSTNLAEAISKAHGFLNLPNEIRVIVIATDGQPDNAPLTLEVARRAKDAGIDIITIGTDDADLLFLQKLASRKELGFKVKSEFLAKSIASTSLLLPLPKSTPRINTCL